MCFHKVSFSVASQSALLEKMSNNSSFAFGQKFLWTFLLWKKVPLDIFTLEKSSFGHFYFGQKFLWTFFLWTNFLMDNFTLDKSSYGHFIFGQKFLLTFLHWKKMPILTFFKLSDLMGTESGRKVCLNTLHWQKIQFDITSFGNSFSFLEICTFGHKFFWEKIHLK